MLWRLDFSVKRLIREGSRGSGKRIKVIKVKTSSFGIKNSSIVSNSLPEVDLTSKLERHQENDSRSHTKPTEDDEPTLKFQQQEFQLRIQVETTSSPLIRHTLPLFFP